jgi:prepilin-type N-terminal cleavage/methylation domain-containing protein
MTPAAPARARSSGFTLIEVMVSLTVLGVAVLALAPLGLHAARQASEVHGATYEAGVLAAEVARLNVLPYAQLTPGTTCATDPAPPVPHTRCTSVTDVSAGRKQIRVVITPAGSSLVPPDTAVVERTDPGHPSPLDSP